MKLVFSAVAIASLCAAPVWAQSDRSANSETRVLLPEPAMLGRAPGPGRQGGQAQYGRKAA